MLSAEDIQRCCWEQRTASFIDFKCGPPTRRRMAQQKILGELVRYFRIPLIVTSIIGNIAVIVVLLRYKVLRRNSSNMLIAQLGFADFVLGAAWTYGYRFYFMVFTALTSLLTIDYMLGELIKLKEVSALTVITIAAYLHQTHVSAQRRENSIVITQTAVMVSYMPDLIFSKLAKKSREAHYAMSPPVILSELIRYLRIPLIVASIFGNLGVIIVLLRYKILRKNSSNMLIAQLGFADFVLGVGLLIRCIEKEMSIAANIQVFNRYNCMLHGATTILGMNLLQATIIMIACDRLSLLVFPIFYRRHIDDMLWSIARFVISIVASLISFGGQFINFSFKNDIVICSSGAAWTDGYRFYFMMFSAFSSILTIVLNAVTVIVYWRQTRISAQRTQNSLVITQTAIIVSYIVFWCTPTIVYMIAVVLGYDPAIFGSITLILSIGSGFFASLNPFLFLWKHTEFRTFFIRFYSVRRVFKSASITAIPSALSHTIPAKL
ncbi:hypothetical protein Tcan_09879 [Toxocara canis]|uniref:G-protein coupled receptors family 1 profile domain-containing protein n=1 Tax=Toxocara canis TaxID=6265 RepID=A0A0B2VHC8_TOXCA|nr:hypothetical protein Tcan_09879 [Toxocara canis]